MRGFGLSGAALALLLLGGGVQAQTSPKTDAAPKAAAAKKQAACRTLKAEAACEGRTDCQWVGESKDAKGKVKAKAYCRSKPKESSKTEPKK
jgi:hypothetical protein